MPKPNRRSLSLAALAAAPVDLFQGDAERVPPKEFRIFPAGVISTTKGDFLFDDQAAKAVMAAYEQHGVDLTIDYDHHTLAAPMGVKAISAGWFGLELRNGELWAVNVNWTPPAAQHLANGEYRYFSPLFDYERQSNRITNLINNALTNTPAMDGIDALVAASQHASGGTDMDPELKKALDRIAELEKSINAKDSRISALEGQTATVALAATVGLAAGAQDAEVRTAVAGLVRFQKQVLETLGKTDEGTAIGALTALKEKAGQAEALASQIKDIETAALSSEWKTYLDGLSTTGQGGKFLEPANRARAEKLAVDIGGGVLTRKGIDGAKEYVVGMLTAGGGARTELPSQLGLSNEVIKMLKIQGQDPQAFIEFETKRLAAGGR